MSLSFSFDFLLSRASRDVLSDSLARSIQALWTIKSLPVTAVAGAFVKAFHVLLITKVKK